MSQNIAGVNVFGRLASLIKSNINDLISKAEDPEKMLNQVIHEMNNQLVEAKKQVAASIADEKRLERQLLENKAKAEDWERKAMLAVKAVKDDLAKEALLRKQEYDGYSQGFQQEWEKQRKSYLQTVESANGERDKAWAARTRDLDFIRVDAAAFAASPSDSIDYAVMEHTQRACVVPFAAD